LRHNHYYLYRARSQHDLCGTPNNGEVSIQAVSSARTEAEIDFVANNPGLTLFHCHQQLHMDFGFMTLLDEV
jgi:FtsP/CotA-like multicopper oxidase with cupredoxin domain